MEQKDLNNETINNQAADGKDIDLQKFLAQYDRESDFHIF